MNTYYHGHKPSWHRKFDTFVIALIFIIVGLLFLGRNSGWVDPSVFSMIVSWQMLLIVMGVAMLIKRNFIGGLIMITVGGYFLLPAEIGLKSYWPIMLVIIGVGILFRSRSRRINRHTALQSTRDAETDDGYVTSDITFGGAKHIVMDPYFRGASLDVTFGGVVLDLRHTQLEVESTYINIDITFSGMELYVPSSWDVIIEAETTFGEISDKRFVSQEMDTRHKLVLRGDVTFGGVDIKN